MGTVIAGDIKKMKKSNRPDKVLITIVTDGHENASNEYNSEDIKRLINKKEKDDWQFIYLAANQDAALAGGSIGVMLCLCALRKCFNSICDSRFDHHLMTLFCYIFCSLFFSHFFSPSNTTFIPPPCRFRCCCCSSLQASQPPPIQARCRYCYSTQQQSPTLPGFQQRFSFFDAQVLYVFNKRCTVAAPSL